MGVNDLCRKCRLVTSGSLVILESESSMGSHKYLWGMLQYFNFWIVEDCDTEPDEREAYFRSCATSEQVIGAISRDWALSKEIRFNPVPLLHHSLASLRREATKGCHLCSKFQDVLQLNKEVSLTSDESNIWGVPVIQVTNKSRNANRKVFDGWTDKLRDEEILFISLIFVKQQDAIQQVGRSEVSTRLIAPTTTIHAMDAFFVGGRLRRHTVNRLSAWLKSCKDHELCSRGFEANAPQSPPARLPTRLLQVFDCKGELHVRLIESRSLAVGDVKIRYAALSHCWGKRGLLAKLLGSNLISYMSGFPLSSLPRTFRDAFEVVSALGLQYIWIDALCIIQDSSHDWSVESSRMLSVYSGAAFTIAATTSVDSEGGLFSQDNLLTSCVFRTEWTGSVLPRGVFSTTTEGGVYEKMIDSAVLNSRGWVFQERLLSPRIIHFAQDQVWWECRQGRDKENSASLDLVPRPVRNSFEFLETGRWTEIAARYSRAALTHRSDKLVAVSGIAEVFAMMHGYEPSEYVAGLWLPDIKEQLLWMHRDLYAQQDTSVAPSWSWACVDAAIEFTELSGDNGDIREWRYGLEVVEANITRNPVSKFGAVSSGQLIIKTVIYPVDLSRREWPEFLFGLLKIGSDQYVHDSSPEKVEVATFYYRFDDQDFLNRPENSDSLSAYFMPMRRRRFETEGQEEWRWPIELDVYAGLLLARVEKDTYTRLGILRISFPRLASPEWWLAGCYHDLDKNVQSCSHCVDKIILM